LRIVHSVADDGAETELLRLVALVTDGALGARVDRIPAPGELLDRHSHVEVVGEKLLECDRGSLLRCEESDVEEERLVITGKGRANLRQSDTGEIGEVAGQRILAATLVRGVEVRLLPTTVEDRQHAVMEDVE